MRRGLRKIGARRCRARPRRRRLGRAEVADLNLFGRAGQLGLLRCRQAWQLLRCVLEPHVLSGVELGGLLLVLAGVLRERECDGQLVTRLRPRAGPLGGPRRNIIRIAGARTTVEHVLLARTRRVHRGIAARSELDRDPDVRLPVHRAAMTRHVKVRAVSHVRGQLIGSREGRYQGDREQDPHR